MRIWTLDYERPVWSDTPEGREGAQIDRSAVRVAQRKALRQTQDDFALAPE